MNLRPLAAALALALSGCAGTSVQMAGQVCGQPVDLTLIDRKDRSGFEGEITCPQGGGVRVSSSESSASAVLAQQAQVIERLTSLLARSATPMALDAPVPQRQPRPRPVILPALKPRW